jgi:hypothetical protein
MLSIEGKISKIKCEMEIIKVHLMDFLVEVTTLGSEVSGFC